MSFPLFKSHSVPHWSKGTDSSWERNQHGSYKRHHFEVEERTRMASARGFDREDGISSRAFARKDDLSSMEREEVGRKRKHAFVCSSDKKEEGSTKRLREREQVIDRSAKNAFYHDKRTSFRDSKDRLDYRDDKHSQAFFSQKKWRSDSRLIPFNKGMAQIARGSDRKETREVERRADDLMWEIKREGLKPDVYTYSSLIQVFVKTNNPIRVFQAFKEMQKAGVQPDAVTYNTLLNLYVKQEDGERALAVLEEMRKAGLRPNAETYNTLLHLYVKQEDGRRALAVLDKMKETGVRPSEVTYTTLLHLYVKQEDGESALAVLEEMKEAGVRPDVVTYTALLHFFVKQEDGRSALAVLEEMRKAGLRPNEVTYTTLLNLYVKQEDGRRALAVLEEMKEVGLRPNAVTYNTLLNLYVKQEDGKRALAVLEKMKKVGLRPNNMTYTMLLHLYVKQEDERNALAVLEEMEEAGVRPSEVTYHLMIDFCIQRKDLKTAERLFTCIAHLSSIGQKNGKDYLDCHGLSHGTACVMIHHYLEAKQNDAPFMIVTGIGNHTRNEKFAMKTKVKQFLQEFYPEVYFQEEEHNLGILSCEIIKKAFSLSKIHSHSVPHWTEESNSSWGKKPV